MNDCFTIHVHRLPDGQWAAHETTITGRKITTVPIIGNDKVDVMGQALTELAITADFVSPVADVPADDRGFGGVAGQMTMPPYVFDGSWMESVAQRAVDMRDCPGCKTPMGTRCDPNGSLEKTCLRRLLALETG